MEFVIVSGGSSHLISESILKIGTKSNVIFTYNKSKEYSKKLESKFKKINNTTIIPYRLNLSNETQIIKFSKFLRRKKIKAFVHNAFVMTKRNKITNIKQKFLKDYILSNCYGSFLLTKLIIDIMIKNKTSKNKSITFISSQSAIYGGNKLSPYSASKGFINSLSTSLSKELGNLNIRSNTISLGKFETKNQKTSTKKNNLNDIPLKKLGKPTDVASIIFNLIYESHYLSGANIKLSGGR